MDNELKFECGWYIPAKDLHIITVMKNKNCFYNGRLMYQFRTIEACVSKIPKNRRGIALDIGSHIGTWAYILMDNFDFVHCFEPIKIHQDCWRKNIDKYKNSKLYPMALGNKDDKIKMMYPEETTVATYVEGHNYNGKGKQILFDNIPMTTLDSFEFTDVDFIKIDVEGHQLEVIKGAEQTILKNKPYILVEDHSKGTPAFNYLKDHFGMRLVFEYKMDFFMEWVSG